MDGGKRDKGSGGGVVPSSRPLLAWACGRTVGPGLPRAAGGGCEGAAFVVEEVGGAVAREGYFLAAAPPAVRAAFEVEEPMFVVWVDWLLQGLGYQ